ncbi:cell cycle checkpoint protein [Cryptococcus gattii E566]|nr:cell cycle checkpoint protein [Cryptococcus gattii E566]
MHSSLPFQQPNRRRLAHQGQIASFPAIMSQSSDRSFKRTDSSSSKGSIMSSSLAPSSAGSSKPMKKMGSLSSFQASLSFKSHGLGSNKKEQDRKLMPPPSRSVSPVKMDSSHKGSDTSSSSKAVKIPNAKEKGKGKNPEIIEVLSSDEEEERQAKVTRRESKTAQSVKKKEKKDTAQMWTDLYAPTLEADLAPGKARIQKVKAWLHESLYGYPPDVQPPPLSTRDKLRKYRRILLMTGPAGGGKTTTVRLLAEQMGVDIIEWGESVEEWSLGTGIERESSISKFSSFLSRNSYPSLNLSQSPSSSSSRSVSQSRPRLILLTALPNLTHLPTRDAFHVALLTFCQTFTHSSCPMIIIHSDAGSGGRAEEGWMDRDKGGRERVVNIIGQDVKNGPCFIPVAPTFILKALNRVISLNPLPPAQRPTKATLQLIAQSSNGDLRSAINSLQLLCGGRKHGDKDRVGKKRKEREEEVVSGSKGRGKGRGSMGGRGAKLDVGSELRAVLDAVTRKEQSLHLFHALGKVFYNKRLGDPDERKDEDQEVLSAIRQLPPDDPLPGHLSGYTRRKALVQMEDFIPSIPIDSSSFALWIHQTFPSFCTDVEQVAEGMDYLCLADVMRTDDDIWHSSPQSIAYALYLTIRGIHIALPSPVIRNRQKVLKPQFFKAFAEGRDNQLALEGVARYLEKKGTVSNNREAAAWGGLVGKRVMACEMVPMMVKIQSLSNHPLLPSSAQTLVLPPYTPLAQCHISSVHDELTAKAELGEDEGESLEATMAGDDGMGDVRGHEHLEESVWDKEGVEGNEEGEEDYLLDDDIVDWD